MNSVSSLVVRIEGDAKDYYNTLRQVESAAQQMAKGMVTAGKRMTATLTAPLVGLGAAAFYTAANFEQAMAEVGAVANANAQEMTSLTAAAEELGRTTAFSASEAASGMKFLAMAGFKTNEIIAAMPGMLHLAAAAAADLGTTADITSNVLSGFGLKAEESTRVADVLAKTLTTSNTDLQQLGDAMSYVAPVAASMGIGIETVSAAIGIMSNAGIQGTKAGTGLRGVLMRLGAPTKDAKAMMDQLGVSIYDAEGKMKGLPDIVDQFSLAFEGMTDEQRMSALDEIVGKISAPAFLSMIAAGGDELRRFSGELQNAGGTAATVAARQLDTFQGKVKLLRSALEGLAIAVGDYLLPAATKIVEGITPAVSGMATAFANMQPWAKKLTLGFAAFLAAIGPVLWAVGALWGWISGLGTAMASIGSVIAGLTGWWVVLAAAIGAAVYFDVGGIRTRISTALQAFRDWGSALKTELLPEFEDFATYARAAIEGVASGTLSWDDFRGLVQKAFDSIDYKSIREKIMASLGLGEIDMSVDGITAAVTNWWQNIPWQTIWGNVEGAYDTVTTAVSTWWQNIPWQTIWGNVDGAYDTVTTAVSTWWQSIPWQTIWGNVDGAYDTVTTAVTTWWQNIPWQTIWGNVEGAYDTVTTAVTTWWQNIPWQTIWGNVEGAYDTVTTAVTTWWQSIPWGDIFGGEANDTVSGLVKAVANWWQSLSWSSIFGGGESEDGDTVGMLQQFTTWWQGIDWSGAFVNGMTGLLNGLTTGLDAVNWETIGTVFRVAVESLVITALATGFTILKAPERLVDLAGKLAGGIKAVIEEMTNSEEFKEAWSSFKDSVMNAVKGFIFGTEEGLVAWESLISDTLSSFLEGNWKLPTFEGWATYITWPSISELVPDWSNLIKFPSAGEWTGAFKEWLTSKWRIPGFGGGEDEADNNATGTDYFRGGWTWVGENGPELMQLPRGAQVMPQHRAAMAADVAASSTNNITIHVGNVDSDERVNQLANRILDTIDRRR